MSERSDHGPAPLEVPRKAADEPPGVFDKPGTIRLMKIVAYVSVAVLVLFDVLFHHHEILGPEGVPGYYLLGGFLASVALIAVAKLLGKGLKRGTDYYADD